MNEAFDRQTGLEDPAGRTVRELVPDLEPHWFEIYGRIARSREPERFEAPAAPLHRYYEAYAFPVGPAEEHRIGVLFRDISDRKQAEEQHRMLTHELSHRVKNTLAVVQALARQPGMADMTVEQYRDRFIGRIQALARAHDQLLETNWQSADLATLVRATLSAYGRDGAADQVVDGPAGAADAETGPWPCAGPARTGDQRLEIRRPLDRGRRASVSWDWSEGRRANRCGWPGGNAEDLPCPRAGPPEGFGTKLIQRACAYELEGSAELGLAPEGLTA